MTPPHDSYERFEQCVDMCADGLYRLALRLTSNSALAAELVQETYLQAWKNMDQLKETDKLRAWMFAILRNQYTKLLRREVREVSPIGFSGGRVPLDNAMENIAANPNGNNPGRDLELKEAVQLALEQLDDKHKFPLLLVTMEGLSVEEAADVLDLPRGTVLSRLHRGRAALKQHMACLGFESPRPLSKD